MARESLFSHQSPCCEVSLTGLVETTYLFVLKDLVSALQSHTNFVRHRLFCVFFIQDSWDEQWDMQWFSNLQHHHLRTAKCFSDIVYQKMSTVEYRANFCGLQLICLYIPAVTLETPNSKINIPVCIITCVWRSETI